MAVTSCGFDHLRDVLVPDGQGSGLHVDFLLLTMRGVVVIDLRDVAGNIFGGDQMADWTVMDGAQRFTFPNPQTALYDRIAAVRALARNCRSRAASCSRAAAGFPRAAAPHADARFAARGVSRRRTARP